MNTLSLIKKSLATGCACYLAALSPTLHADVVVGSPGLPDLSGVELSASSPTASFFGDDSIYEVIPIGVSASGTFAYSDVSYGLDCGIDQEILIYQNAFDPTDTALNLIDNFDDDGEVALSAGVDYFIVTKPLNDTSEGSAVFVLSSEDGGIVTGLPAVSSGDCIDLLQGVDVDTAYIVNFDGTEAVADFDGDDYQYFVVGSFESDGVTPPPAWNDYGYNLTYPSYSLDTRAWYFAGEFTPGDTPFDDSDDSNDSPLPEGSYTLVISTYDDGGGVSGRGLRGPVISTLRAPATPVPALPFGGVVVLILSVSWVARKRFNLG